MPAPLNGQNPHKGLEAWLLLHFFFLLTVIYNFNKYYLKLEQICVFFSWIIYWFLISENQVSFCSNVFGCSTQRYQDLIDSCGKYQWLHLALAPWNRGHEDCAEESWDFKKYFRRIEFRKVLKLQETKLQLMKQKGTYYFELQSHQLLLPWKYNSY